MDITRLPPAPDPATGMPRPPSAPLADDNGTSLENGDSKRSKVPDAPPGEGPVLEWYYPTKTTRVVTGLVTSAAIILLYIVRSGFSWVGNIWLWGLIALPVAVFLLAGRSDGVSAGADWLAASRKTHVKNYRLTKVTVHVDGIAHVVQLVDEDGGSARIRIGLLQLNHKLWDLVYNGILHSVHVGGAETNKRAREYLQLDNPPHLRW